MTNMAMVKAIFYVPLWDNDGSPLRDKIDDLEVMLYAHFVGWTKHGIATGAFQMVDGSRSDDSHIVFYVVLDEARLEELEGLLLDFKKATLQESICLEIQRNVECRFLK
jgi:hypothetical protein